MLFPLVKSVSEGGVYEENTPATTCLLLNASETVWIFYPPLLLQKPLSRGGLTILNKGTALWSSSVVKQPPRGFWKKVVLSLKSSAGLWKSQQRRKRGKSPNTPKNSMDAPHTDNILGLLSVIDWYYVPGKKIWLKGYANAALLFASLSLSLSRWWCTHCYQSELMYESLD